jgi:dihydrofolate reductase
MRLTVTAHLTLDGVMQSNGKPEPELKDGFEQGGWQVPYFDADLDRMTADWIAAADAFLLGRRTYELFADGTTPAAFRLTGTKTTSRGVVAHVYQPAGAPACGTVAAEPDGDIARDPASRPGATT